ncbi:MAG: CBS domain-containing protein [Maribacter sp.]|uniref:CBS domain-containing protein n=1 Tax=Maribacter sp. TaxID=1897614 RepID=UPI003298159B
MGELDVERLVGSTLKEKYISQLLGDLEAIEQMLDQRMFDTDIHIGAEQEFCLVNEQWEPSNKAMEVLKALNDPHFTNEIALYNLEANLDPLLLTEDCFAKLHEQLNDLLAKAKTVAAKQNLKVILTGILPTIDSRHLHTSFMTPVERYQVLDETIRDLRGDDLELHIKGVDELNLHHDSILFEGCNTSFQAHLQLDATDFAAGYNWAQAIAGPVLSICANSPILMGRELWQETRIALFTQSVDTRASNFLLNERDARVGFGNDWARGSIVDFYKDSIVNFRSLLSANFSTDSLLELKQGKIPKLQALQLHNGTVYKWNRLCYGVTKGKPHVRIENRYMPSGPTTTDEIANFMFWAGIMCGRPRHLDNIHEKMDFKDAKGNFYNAARYGTAAQFYWEGKLIPCKELLLDHFLPMAYRGLYSMNVLPRDAEKYLAVIENRIKNKNGARWTIQSFRELKKEHKTADALRILTASIYEHEQKGYTVDAWRLARGNEYVPEEDQKQLRHYMNTKIVTAQENDSADLVLKMMQWRNIHHVPIMDIHFNLVGLLTWEDVKNYQHKPEALKKSVKSIMKTKLITATADIAMLEAKETMQLHQINCLPVIKGKKLVGIITTNDF